MHLAFNSAALADSRSKPPSHQFLPFTFLYLCWVSPRCESRDLIQPLCSSTLCLAGGDSLPPPLPSHTHTPSQPSLHWNPLLHSQKPLKTSPFQHHTNITGLAMAEGPHSVWAHTTEIHTELWYSSPVPGIALQPHPSYRPSSLFSSAVQTAKVPHHEQCSGYLCWVSVHNCHQSAGIL